MNFTRFGVYYTAPKGPFADAGANWLGWDIATGQPKSAPAPDAVATPRKYGFHGTIKPPFRLANGLDIKGLQTDLENLCGSSSAVHLDGLQISQLGRFLALTPIGPTQELAALAATVVRDLDQYRAPPTQAELEKRRKAKLSAAQESNLDEWGYPYVFEEFRFHMTLSGALPSDELSALSKAAEEAFSDVIPSPLMVDALTLVGQAEDGQFHAMERFSLSGK